MGVAALSEPNLQIPPKNPPHKTPPLGYNDEGHFD